MVGLSDIPCVGKIVDRISDATVDSFFRGFRYLFCYKDLANVLNSEIEKVSIQEGWVSRKIVAERANGKTIEDHVLKWQEEVAEMQESAKVFSEKYKKRSSWRCIKWIPIPKPISRFRLGREAVQKAKRVTELFSSGADLLTNEIAYLPPVEYIPATDTTFQNFESRKDAYGKLWEALVTEGTPILGIYGMPGVGKTRMMEQIWEEAMDKKIFDKIARADVGSDNLDVIKLQNQIACHLDCHFDSQDDKKHRANQLKNSFMNSGNILVILDDVWREIPLDIIGIPLGDGSRSKCIKILLTSRKKDVCLLNNCKHPIHITILTVQEAWALFKNNLGASHIDYMQDESLAQKVCLKCSGLPLLICAVGKALQFTSHSSWKDALDQLEKGKFENIAGIDPQVYACVQLSIDRLPDDAKSCLLLCSLFPEDTDIDIRKLIQLATSSQLVPDGEYRVCAMVDILRTSSLLLDCELDDVIKLHDLIRDVARSIAVNDPKYAFLLVRCGSRLLDNADYCTRKLLHLHLEQKEFCFPDGLVCPDVHSLWLQCNNHIQQFSGGFFSMFGNLRFLLIEGMFSTLELQFSLQPLDQLKTLIFYDCNLKNIDQTNVSLFPENLETLCIWNSLLPVPLDLPNLKYLRKLEINFGNAVHMMPNTISRLPSLEELHIPHGIYLWDGPSTNRFRVSRSMLVEISKLTHLKSLQVYLRESEPFEDIGIFGNLLEFNICVGDPGEDFCHHLNSSVFIKRSIQLHRNQFKALESLIERAEEVILNSSDMNVSSIYDRNREAFPDLRKLFIEECKTMEYIASISQDEIQNSLQSRTSFSKLITLEIRSCCALKYLFSKSVAKCLLQLQELNIHYCFAMIAIIVNEGTDDGDIINFSKLKSLKLSHMPRLQSFYVEKKDMHFSSTSITDSFTISSDEPQPLFNGMVTFPSLEELDITYLGNTSDIWGKYALLCKLRILSINECHKLETVIPLGMLTSLRYLETLEISYCDSLRNVFRHSSIARDIMHLQKLEIVNCKMMSEIIGEGEKKEEITNDGIIVFPQLTSLCLYDLPNLSSFWCYQSGEANTYKVRFPNIVYFQLHGGVINLEDIGLGSHVSSSQVRSLCIECGKEIQLPSKWPVQLYNLERLELGHCWPHQLKSICFQQLKVLHVHNSGCSTLFTFSAFRSLQHLQKLEISNSNLLEKIVEDVRGDETYGIDKKIITLFRLRSVVLKDLPNLKSFVDSVSYEFHMPALVEVVINKCGLSTLFTCSVFRKLPQLKDIYVSNCGSLENIVKEVSDGETCDVNNMIITLAQLSKVYLEYLPSLKSFSRSSRYAFNMPKLRTFRLIGCPQTEYFTFLETSTALVSVRIEWQDWKEIHDLNDYINQNRLRGSSFCDSFGESSYIKQELETELEKVEEGNPQAIEEHNQHEQISPDSTGITQEETKHSACTFYPTSTTAYGKM